MQEVLTNSDGTRTLMAHQPTAQLYPALTANSLGSHLMAAQVGCASVYELER